MTIERKSKAPRSLRVLQAAGAVSVFAAFGTVISVGEAVSNANLANDAGATAPYETGSPVLVSSNPAPGSPEAYRQDSDDSTIMAKFCGTVTVAAAIVAMASGIAVAGRREHLAAPIQDRGDII